MSDDEQTDDVITDLPDVDEPPTPAPTEKN